MKATLTQEENPAETVQARCYAMNPRRCVFQRPGLFLMLMLLTGILLSGCSSRQPSQENGTEPDTTVSDTADSASNSSDSLPAPDTNPGTNSETAGDNSVVDSRLIPVSDGSYLTVDSNEDGSQTTTYINQMKNVTHKVTTYQNDRTITEYLNGEISITENHNGDRIIQYPQGVKATAYANGVLEIQYPEGIKFTVNPSETVFIIEYPDGMSTTGHYEVFPDGEKTTGEGFTKANPDGSIVTAYPDGMELIVRPDRTDPTHVGGMDTIFPYGVTIGVYLDTPENPKTLTVKLPDGTTDDDRTKADYYFPALNHNSENSLYIRYSNGTRTKVKANNQTGAVSPEIETVFPDGKTILSSGHIRITGVTEDGREEPLDFILASRPDDISATVPETVAGTDSTGTSDSPGTAATDTAVNTPEEEVTEANRPDSTQAAEGNAPVENAAADYAENHEAQETVKDANAGTQSSAEHSWMTLVIMMILLVVILFTVALLKILGVPSKISAFFAQDEEETDHSTDTGETDQSKVQIMDADAEKQELKNKIQQLEETNRYLEEECSQLEEENLSLRKENRQLKKSLPQSSGIISLPGTAEPVQRFGAVDEESLRAKRYQDSNLELKASENGELQLFNDQTEELKPNQISVIPVLNNSVDENGLIVGYIANGKLTYSAVKSCFEIPGSYVQGLQYRVRVIRPAVLEKSGNGEYYRLVQKGELQIMPEQ